MIDNPGVDVDTSRFSYPGPLPHSKETAVVMLTDGIEATAHSLKEKTADSFREMIDNLVEQKIRSNQLIDANLTLRDITILKKTLLDKLVSIYHVRIEYPK
jgi:membrane-associated HD superfamily phosphohydrolase